MAGRSVSNPPVRTSDRVSGVYDGSGLSARARSSPSRAVRASRSSSRAGTPALAKCAAICAPIVPAPSTATEDTRESRPMATGSEEGEVCAMSGF